MAPPRRQYDAAHEHHASQRAFDNARDSKGGAGAKNMKEGLAATQKTRQVEVKDTTPPVATLVGATEIVHHVGQAKNCTTMPCYDPWANCTDTCDTTIAPPASNHADEWEGGKVWNERVPGTYVRRYWCEDASGNTDYVRRTITIVDKTTRSSRSWATLT